MKAELDARYRTECDRTPAERGDLRDLLRDDLRDLLRDDLRDDLRGDLRGDLRDVISLIPRETFCVMCVLRLFTKKRSTTRRNIALCCFTYNESTNTLVIYYTPLHVFE